MRKALAKCSNRVLLRGQIEKISTYTKDGCYYAWLTIQMSWINYYGKNKPGKPNNETLRIKVAAFNHEGHKRKFVPFDELTVGEEIIIKGHMRPDFYGPNIFHKHYATVVATNIFYSNGEITRPQTESL